MSAPTPGERVRVIATGELGTVVDVLVVVLLDDLDDGTVFEASALERVDGAR
ncbi:hypothetical protein [Nocardia sp. NPDC057227]|uniref:hypothetical protein n=1 Tax=Nocardia sp. NPDC057227 TaxID=3346056 RepID=UPI0036291437